MLIGRAVYVLLIVYALKFKLILFFFSHFIFLDGNFLQYHKQILRTWQMF